MTEITKVSDITASDVAEYIRLDEVTTNDTNLLNTLILVSKNYIKQYTGRSDEDLDTYQDMVIVVLVLCQDMWDNRTLYVDKSSLNRVVESILDLHSVNLLPEAET